MNKINTVGIDLAKNVFLVHAVDERGKVVVRKQLKRDQMAPYFVNLPPCLVGDGGVCERAFLGAQASELRSFGALDGPAVR